MVRTGIVAMRRGSKANGAASTTEGTAQDAASDDVSYSV
jgi:hypothetical protein